MKKKVLLRLIIAQALFLVACDNSIDSNDSSEANQGQENKETIIKEQIDSDYYRPVITEDGTYAPSKNRGITRSLNSNVNMRTFEVDLMRHSQPYFSVDDYFFQEGQYLSSELVTSWLRREEASEAESDEESDKQMQGLNPPANESEDAGERVPNILNSILEQNFYIQTENGLEFAGVSIGLALNSVDYYQLAQYEATYEQEISREKVLEEGQRIGNEVVSRIRNIEGLENIPVMIGLYEQSARDDLAPGTFIATGLSEKDQTEVSDWKKINEERVIFPLEGMQSAVGNNFANFKSEVENFFPNVSGVTGLGHYIENQLVDLEISVTTQFYGKGEMIAFTQFLNEAGKTYLPGNVPTQINVESLNGMESYLNRENDKKEYEVYIFN
ncbi:MAG: CamS family sex pheromone protein [Alkalibacterium gilvum]|uniref:Protein involved in sex pheromone biosynthesis n=1 Tax=Alkalibacterium gilvum TaxID=1130080 RepID=A0A1H6THR5_9LACT|nr:MULTISPECIES: CamS family sex pheromone protein [Alkalibacterium]MDN6193449.1 CamS family sex pheromone protein [Alkalibacterium sp.]MDN6293312.1 CamS family sex pheromone protein [Alkalibacterium sp.]MDN6295320.1 CamS family sex pheromone protein [Alkalibacterium sp.]MDN6397509.1 CamS family sex pheromone protein [Alkalibacterium sp.]MDN6729298.1 CamS family sex pheromone protein [Alkalibacterium sp.]